MFSPQPTVHFSYICLIVTLTHPVLNQKQLLPLLNQMVQNSERTNTTLPTQYFIRELGLPTRNFSSMNDPTLNT